MNGKWKKILRVVLIVLLAAAMAWLTILVIQHAESKKEYFAAASRSTPNARAVVMVIPDLETPGIAAATA